MNAFNYTTHSKQVLGDLHTPVSIYLKVRDMYPQSALMESSDYHAGENSLSFIALCPLASIGINSGIVTTTYPDNTRREEPLSQSFRVENALNRFINRFHVEGDDKKFCGLYGYTTFNAVKYFEHIPVKESHDEQNDAPDLLYILYKYIIVFNHFKNELTLVEMLAEGEESNLSQLESAIENRNYASYNFSVTGPVTSTITDEEHKANVRKGIAHCLRGDVFQIVLSRRFIQPYAGDDFKVYRALRSINPSPYLFYFDFGGYRIFGSSPETHCKVESGQAYIDPIAGTTRRTGDTIKDKEPTEALLADPKENAEHVMPRRTGSILQRTPILQPCHPSGEPRQRCSEQRSKSAQDLYRHFPCRNPERCAQGTCHAAYQRNRTSQPRSLRRLYRLHRPERRIEPGDNDPHFRKPQQRIVVPGRRRYRSTQSGRIRTARSQ